ncbi:ABC transporter substrate-binding protein [Nakamurella sp. YIM 132087]|uniref:ABC transporter substrate-binding protein n=1 Tax=Nakamurella alba TaxID=2665158 RepID=A0A7K1FLP6_9ACTN|nr:ABC transporter substrate-binding protein [Nakamurella alba]MTD14153.1 ABC transporter substrate-binding protein [Nakamurella alba]
MSSTFRRLGVPAIAGLALLASACTATAPTTQTSAGGATGSGSSSAAAGPVTTDVAFSVATTTLDPASGCTLDDVRLTMGLYVQLMQYGERTDANGVKEQDPTKVEPYFATDYEVSADGLSYTFTLPSDWKFPSGAPMDAEAVKYSIDRVNSIAGCGQAIVNDLYLDPLLIKEITVVDPTTVKFDLNFVDANFPLAMATPSASIVDPTLVEANGGVVDATPNEWMASHDAGSGPFRLASYEPGTKAVLEKDPNFKGEAPASDVINVNWIKSDSAMLLELQNGSLDIVQGLTKNSAASLQDTEGFTVAASTATANMGFLMPNDKEPWTNEKVREAVTYAIPYEDILNNVLKGYGQLYYGPVPPTMPGYDAADSTPRTYDVEKAKALMAEAGVTTPITVTLDTISGDATQASIATILQSALGELGIEVTVNPLSESAWGDQVYGLKTQAALRLDGPAIFSAGYYLSYDEACGISFNTGVICVPGNDVLLKEVRAAKDDAERDAALAQLTKNWVADSPKAILYLDATAVVMKTGTEYLWNQYTDMRTWKAAA